MIYRCLMVGEDFPVIEGRQAKLFGFAATRWVEANSDREAELQAVEALKNEPRFNSSELRDPRSRIRFEELTVVEATDVPDVLPGLAWFPMDSN